MSEPITCLGAGNYAPFYIVIEDTSAGMKIHRGFVRCPECNEWFETSGRFGLNIAPSDAVPGHLYDLERGPVPFTERPRYKLAIEHLRGAESRRILTRLADTREGPDE